jgi:hypothetical protein
MIHERKRTRRHESAKNNAKEFAFEEFLRGIFSRHRAFAFSSDLGMQR